MQPSYVHYEKTMGLNRRPGVMSKFRITELSGVDRPAQEGARAVIMKKAAPPAPSPEPVTFAKRREATRDALDALATAKARAEGISFAKAYDRLCVEMGPALGPHLV